MIAAVVPDRRAIERGKRAGAAWARSLDRRRRGEFLDDQILGAFDWSEWFDDRPAPGFIRGAYEAARDDEERGE